MSHNCKFSTLIVILLLLAGYNAFAQVQCPNPIPSPTYTGSLNLPQIPNCYQNWGTLYNQAMTTLDGAIAPLQAIYQGQWNMTATYGKGQFVSFNQVYYQSNISGNIGNEPGTAPSDWTVFFSLADLAGGSGGTSLEINGNPSLSPANFNNAIPSPPTGSTNVHIQQDASGNVSLNVPTVFPGNTLEVNGVPVPSPTNLNNVTPAPPTGSVNVQVQQDASGNVSFSVPASTGGTGTTTSVSSINDLTGPVEILGPAVTQSGNTITITGGAGQPPAYASGSYFISFGDSRWSVSGTCGWQGSNITGGSITGGILTANGTAGTVVTGIGLKLWGFSGSASVLNDQIVFPTSSAAGTFQAAVTGITSLSSTGVGQFGCANAFSTLVATSPNMPSTSTMQIASVANADVSALMAQYTALVHPYTFAVTGQPCTIIFQGGVVGLYDNADSVAATEEQLQSAWAQFHSDGCTVVETTIIPEIPNSLYSDSNMNSDTQTINKWIAGQANTTLPIYQVASPTTPCTGGCYWDQIVDAYSLFPDPTNSFLFNTVGGTPLGHLTDAGNNLLFSAVNYTLLNRASAPIPNLVCNTWLNDQCSTVALTFNGRALPTTSESGDYTAAEVINAVTTNTGQTVNGAKTFQASTPTTTPTTIQAVSGMDSMTPAIVQSANSPHTGGPTSVAFSSPVTAGNALLVVCPYGTVWGPSDSLGNTWTAISGTGNWDSGTSSYLGNMGYGNNKAVVAVALNSSAGADTITCGNGSAATAVEISNIVTSSAQDASTAFSVILPASGTSYTVPSFITSQMDALLEVSVCNGANNGLTSFSATGFTTVTTATAGGCNGSFSDVDSILFEAIPAGTYSPVLSYAPSTFDGMFIQVGLRASGTIIPQSADLQQIKDSSGAVLSGVNSAGIPYVVPQTYASLTASTPCGGSPTNEGKTAAVTDSTVGLSSPGSIVAGGGSNHVPVYCNGANWVVN